MFEIIDTFKIGNNLSVTFAGRCEELKNGSQLKDNKGNLYTVVSVGTTRHDNPSDVKNSTNVLITPCDLKKGSMLYIK